MTHTHTHTQIRTLHIYTLESAGSDDDQDNMFSTFRMRNGEEYTVYNKDGKRYYVDWETQVGNLIYILHKIMYIHLLFHIFL